MSSFSLSTLKAFIKLGLKPGLGVGIHTSAKTPDELYLLLSGLRFPFKAK